MGHRTLPSTIGTNLVSIISDYAWMIHTRVTMKRTDVAVAQYILL